MRKQRQATHPTPAAPVGYSVRSWAASVGIGTSTFYTLPAEYRPESVKIGDRHIITEPGADWLKRMAKRGGVPRRQRKKA